MHLRSTLLAALLAVSVSVAELIAPLALSDCAQVTGTTKITCPRDGGCCSAGDCCAGGCCPIGAVCINKGRGDEGCCPLDDATSCGLVLPTLTKACDGRPRASVTCTAAETSWPCPPDSNCGVRFGACFAIANTCTGSGGVTPTASGGAGPATTASQSGSGHSWSGYLDFQFSVALGATVLMILAGVAIL